MSGYVPETPKRFKVEPLRLKSLKEGNVYFNKSDDILNTVSQSGVIVECPVTQHLIKELDRRLCQLWDMVAFERENKLVSYEALDANRDYYIATSSARVGHDKNSDLSNFTELVNVLNNCKYIRVYENAVEAINALNEIIVLNENMVPCGFTTTKIPSSEVATLANGKLCTKFNVRYFKDKTLPIYY